MLGPETIPLLASSILLFMYTVLIEFGLSMPEIQVYYEIATRIFDQRSSWAAVTTIVGTTVALVAPHLTVVSQTASAISGWSFCLGGRPRRLGGTQAGRGTW